MAARPGKGPQRPKDDPPPAQAAPDTSVPHLSPEEVRAAHYHRLMTEHRGVDSKLAEIDSARKGVNKRRTEVRNQLKKVGFFLSNVDNVLAASAKTADRKEERDKVNQLHWMREQEGLPVAKTEEQLDMFARMPQTEQEGVLWEEAAYHAGVIGEALEIPAKCPPIFHQRYSQFWHKGKDRRDWALAQEINPERLEIGTAASRPELDPEPEDEDQGEDICATCAGDGTGLDEDVGTCPDCGAEYEVYSDALDALDADEPAELAPALH